MITCLLSLVFEIAVANNVPPRLAQGVLLAENWALDPEAVSHTGDLGLMQLNPKYIPWFLDKFWDRDSEDFDVFNPRHNTIVACKYLRWISDSYNMNWLEVVQAYNCGPTRVLSGDIPQSTLTYSENVMRYFNSEEVQPCRD